MKMISRAYLILAGDVMGKKTRLGLCQSSGDGIRLFREQNLPSHTADLLKKEWRAMAGIIFCTVHLQAPK
jgi:hypothetical protein